MSTNPESQLAIAQAARAAGQALTRLAETLEQNVRPGPHVEIGGERMTQSQFDAARFPLQVGEGLDNLDLTGWREELRGRDIGSRYLCGITETRPLYFGTREAYRDHVLTVHPDWPGAEALRAEQPPLEQQHPDPADYRVAAAKANARDLATLEQARLTGAQPCGCSPWAICDTHAAIRAKGCTCHGPCYSSECPNPTHRAQAADTPDLDPSRVG